MSNVNEIGKLARYFATAGAAPAKAEDRKVEAPAPQAAEAVRVDLAVKDSSDSSKTARVMELKAQFAAGELKGSSYDMDKVARTVITDLFA